MLYSKSVENVERSKEITSPCEQTKYLYNFLTFFGLYINLNHISESHYHEHSWHYQTRIFQKKNMPQIFTFKRRRSEIDPYGTLFTISA